MSAAPEALRFMSKARHVGKLVLTRPGFDPEGTVLVTGGTGALGGLVARRLVEHHGVRSLILVGRRGLEAPGMADLAEALVAAGAEVMVTACDTTDRAALAEVLSRAPAGRPLRGIVHAAGVLDDGIVTELSAERLDTVLAPKAIGAWNLHELTRDLDLSAFVLFSSASGISGAPGQANYAAANAFLDALSEHRRRRGLPSQSLAWGLWEQTAGTAGQLDEESIARLRRHGFPPMPPDEALALFDAAVGHDAGVMVPIRIDLPALRAGAQVVQLSPIWKGLVSASGLDPRAVAAPPGMDRSEFDRRLAEASDEGDRLRALVEVVRFEVATLLGHADVSAIDADSTFKDLGLDSLSAVGLRNRLNTLTGLRLPATLAFDRPTVSLLAEELHARMTPAAHVA
jgi:NADP-dependent 3-hydroxy acid dehydrogenase YdfG/acyl carrier protein